MTLHSAEAENLRRSAGPTAARRAGRGAAPASAPPRAPASPRRSGACSRTPPPSAVSSSSRRMPGARPAQRHHRVADLLGRHVLHRPVGARRLPAEAGPRVGRRRPRATGTPSTTADGGSATAARPCAPRVDPGQPERADGQLGQPVDVDRPLGLDPGRQHPPHRPAPPSPPAARRAPTSRRPVFGHPRHERRLAVQRPPAPAGFRAAAGLAPPSAERRPARPPTPSPTSAAPPRP